jgi:hypothetical protein
VVLDVHARRREREPEAPSAVGYRPESLQIHFGDTES